jgi:hypothetical protein
MKDYIDKVKQYADKTQKEVYNNYKRTIEDEEKLKQ